MNNFTNTFSTWKKNWN